ncbi:hypothetical protein TWF788_000443 [Orbilia oligospora]|uniref:Clr5 domain-containing protein n=1 Tax=Orbilia oligospora TaxID=2813651 RepID=A0A7C8Q1H0_ORBOL|nr:hypothetical protein TWF788_000443 [Orbilia oligospora]
MPRGLSKQQWEAHKDLIESLYVHQGYTSTQVCEYLARMHSLRFNERQLEYRLDVWKMGKNLKKIDCKTIDHKVNSSLVRKRNYGSISQNFDFFCNGVRHRGEKVERAMKRYRSSKTYQAPQIMDMGGISVDLPTEQAGLLLRRRTLSDADVLQIIVSMPSVYLTMQMLALLKKEAISMPSRFLITNAQSNEPSISWMSDVSPFLLENLNNEGEDSSGGPDLMTGLDHNVIGQAVQIDMRASPTTFYSLCHDGKALNVRIDIHFLTRFFFRTVYVINNNFITEEEIKIIYKLVTAHHQLGSLFPKILGLKSEGARQFRERIFHFAIRDSRVELLEIYTECEDGKLVSELLSTVNFFELANYSPAVSVILFPYLRAPVRLPRTDEIRALDRTRKEEMDRGLPLDIYIGSRSIGHLDADLKGALARLFVRFFRRLLEHQLVEIDSLGIYKDDALGVESVAIRILLAALEVGDKEIADFLSSNCVSPNIFENPKILLEIILQRNIPAFKIWIRKGPNINASWKVRGLRRPLPAFRGKAEAFSGYTHHNILADTIIAFSYPRQASGELEAAALGTSHQEFVRDNQERIIKIIRLLLKSPGVDLNLRDVNTYRQLNSPCLYGCEISCRDGDTCGKCQNAPRSRLNFKCRKKSCFCSRYPLQGQQFDSIFWGLLQIKDPELQSGFFGRGWLRGKSKFFKWILKEQLQFNNLEDILLHSIGTVLLPSGYSNYQLFRALVKAYPSLKKALGCDRLLNEAIYYDEYEIVDMIIRQISKDTFAYTHSTLLGVGSVVTIYIHYMIRSWRNIVRSQDNCEELLSCRRNSSSTGDVDSPLEALRINFYPRRHRHLDLSEIMDQLQAVSYPRITIDGVFGYTGIMKQLSTNRTLSLRTSSILERDPISRCREIYEVKKREGQDLKALGLIIKILIEKNYIGNLRGLMTLFVQRSGCIGFRDMAGQVLEYLRSKAGAGTNVLFQKAEVFMPILRSLDNGNPDKISRSLVLSIVRPIICTLVRDELDPQFHKDALAILESLVSVYLNIGPESEASRTSDHLFDRIPGLNSMIFANIQQAISNRERASQLLRNLRALKDAGWDINSRDLAGYSLLTHASMSEDDFWSLSDRYEECLGDIYGTAHHEQHASHRSNPPGALDFDLLAFIKGLIDLGAKVDLPPISKHRFGTRGDLTVLLTSVRRGDYKIIEILLEHGATRFFEYSAPKHASEWFGYPSETIATFSNSAHKYDSTSMMNPLQYAAYDGNEKVVLLLLKHGADVDSCLTDGFTALYRAAEMGRMDTVDILLKAGAKKRKFQAIEIADRKGFHEIAEKIREFPITEDGIQRKIEEGHKKYKEICAMIGQGGVDDRECLQPMDIDEEDLQPMEIDGNLGDVTNVPEYISESFIGIMSG